MNVKQAQKKKLLPDESEGESDENYLSSEEEEDIKCFEGDDEEEDELEIDIDKLLQRGELEMKEKESLIENRIKQFEQEKL